MKDFLRSTKNNERYPLRGLDLVFQLSTVLLVMTIGPLLLGVWFDRSFGTAPFATLCFIVLGMLSGTVAMFRVIRDAYKRFGGKKNEQSE